MNKPIKPKKCKICREVFTPFRPLQVCCSHGCAIEYAQKNRQAKERKEYREAKEKQKNLTDWLNDAQKWCNRYIVLRDGKKCITCGTTNPGIQYCAGHYRTRGSASHLRFNEDNIHTQCNANCNMYKSGNISKYRPALIDKIGIERVEALENNNEAKKWTIDEAKEVIAYFKKKIKDLKHGS